MRISTKAVLIGAALLAPVTAANAQTAISGVTTGCFGLNCTAFATNTSFPVPGTGESLTFIGTTFSGITNAFSGGLTIGNFGTLTIVPPVVGSTPAATFSTPFTLVFTLTSPLGSTTSSTTFTASGFLGLGSVDVQYGGGSTGFTYTGGTGTITVDPGQIGTAPTTISGRVTATPAVPEAATWAMMVAGFGVAGAALRRRQGTTAKVAFSA